MNLSRRSLMGSSLIAGAAACTPRTAIVQAPPALPAPWGATPSPRQLKWHDHRQYAFVHFSINTFTDKEWGYGDEDPKLFNPTDFDPDQIVAAAKAGGMTGIILTAKHHDGFCLWPTLLTDHCIRNTPYKNGKGDIVGELEAACRRGGVNFGVYLSPWDRNRADYGTPSYITYYRAQLTELCTRYGKLFEVWFDGANGGDGYYGGARETRKIDAVQYYDWPSIVALVHRLQPDACTFDPLGADIRWVGNEDGHAADPCWPTMPNEPYDQAKGNTGVRGAELWWPAETNVSIRPGWFYHADEDAQFKSPETLMKIYDDSIGNGTTFHLNLPPDRRGRIPDRDVASLTSFGNALRGTFANIQSHGAVATASADTGTTARNAIDGRPDTFWLAPPGGEGRDAGPRPAARPPFRHDPPAGMAAAGPAHHPLRHRRLRRRRRVAGYRGKGHGRPATPDPPAPTDFSAPHPLPHRRRRSRPGAARIRVVPVGCARPPAARAQQRSQHRRPLGMENHRRQRARRRCDPRRQPPHRMDQPGSGHADDRHGQG
jgi:alpha-L-fucosidase